MNCILSCVLIDRLKIVFKKTKKSVEEYKQVKREKIARVSLRLQNSIKSRNDRINRLEPKND
jgi:hypothetical protein